MVAEAIRDYIGDRYLSLASDQRIYFRNVLKLYRHHDGIQIHIDVPSVHNNKDDIFVLDLSSPLCTNLITWADENDLLVDVHKDGKYTGDN